MVICPACAHENPDGQKFCGECGTSLAAPARAPAQERKVITALFCDLVGFTAIAESADPEDVDRMLTAYSTLARAQIEAHGGVVEKFIGDAVVGVFGVPAAHEDDPERAVRAALRITEAAEELTSIGDAPLKLRVGINTGEALVRLGITPDSGGRFLAGDAVNTASRLQSIAPEMGVAVGLETYEATAVIFDYDELEPATLKGKAEPVRVFCPRSPRPRFGTDLTRPHGGPFIGREVDLGMLRGVFEKALVSSSVQLVTVVGEPGIGKSRIVAELFGIIDARPELITWRQGRCLPYGEGRTYWAVGEVLKAHAGILESDPSEIAAAKLEAVLPEGEERAWLRHRLLPLLGVETASGAEREELFTAWRHFFEHVAERDPTVLVFEDLHWADEAMLAFVEYLADRAEGVPLLIVGTARPELFEHHPDYARGLRNSTPINLDPLSEQETARLVSALLETSVIPEELQASILERSGGNPLYAEEFVRLLKDKELLTKRGSSWALTEGAEIPFPDSVQAMIAARLDTLSADRKGMLADAAVLGKVFWAGAVAHMGDRDEEEVTEAMRELSRKELVRPARRSSMAGEAEYAFWHVLARDVAYAQLPRASRASRHVAAATWIESKAPEHVEDLAQMLAYHYTAALELARSAGQSEQAAALEAPALRFLILAGERATGLDTAAAVDAFERALVLSPEGHPERPGVLARFGELAFQSGRFTEAAAALEEAIDTFRTRDDSLSAATAMNTLSTALQRLNDPRSGEMPHESLALLERLPPGPELVDTLAVVARDELLGGHPERGLALAERALEIAAELGLLRPARPLGVRGLARSVLGDPGGTADLREAVELAIQAGLGREAVLLYNNLGITLRNIQGPAPALTTFEEGRSFAEARGLIGLETVIGSSALTAAMGAGMLDEVLTSAVELGAHAEGSGDEFNLMEIRSVEAIALTYRGRARDAAGLLDRLLLAAADAPRPDAIVEDLGSAAIVRAALDDAEAAIGLLSRIASAPNLGETQELAVYLPAIVRAALAVGATELAERIVGHVLVTSPYAEHAQVAANAALAEGRGEIDGAGSAYADAAARWAGFGVPIEEGFALLGRGRCQLELAHPEDALTALERARGIFAGRGMAPALEETDDLIARATRSRHPDAGP